MCENCSKKLDCPWYQPGEYDNGCPYEETTDDWFVEDFDDLWR